MKNEDTNLLELSKYYEIICCLIWELNLVSEIKLVFIAFAINNLEYSFKSSSKEFGLLEDVLIGIRFGLQRNFNEFKTIFECLELLKRNEKIKVLNGNIIAIERPVYTNSNTIMLTPMFKRMMSAVEKLSDNSLIREVIEYV